MGEPSNNNDNAQVPSLARLFETTPQDEVQGDRNPEDEVVDEIQSDNQGEPDSELSNLRGRLATATLQLESILNIFGDPTNPVVVTAEGVVAQLQEEIRVAQSKATSSNALRYRKSTLKHRQLVVAKIMATVGEIKTMANSWGEDPQTHLKLFDLALQSSTKSAWNLFQEVYKLEADSAGQAYSQGCFAVSHNVRCSLIVDDF